MSIEFKLPAVGENIDSADIGQLHVQEGDVITAGTVVADIETDKAVFDLPCPHAGKVAKIHIKTGDTVTIGQLLMTIEETATAETGKPADKPAGKSSDKAAEKPAEKPEDKPVAKSAGKPEEKPAAENTDEEPQAPKSTAKTEPQQTAVATATGSEASANSSVTATVEAGNGESSLPAPAGPATRRLARELGVDLHRVEGTGSGGRITPEDVQAFVRRLIAQPAAAATGGGVAVPPLPDFTQFGPVERQPQNKVMRTGAANLTLAWQTIPHVTQHELADVTELEAARKRFAQYHTGKDGAPKITMTVLALKAIVTALKAFPNFNASLDTASHELILKKYYHLGVAVDTELGLMVPVIRDVDSKSVLQLAGELTELAQKARNRKLSLSDMQGGTFTITNLGGIGGTAFTPIINYPEVAILGMSRSTLQQVIINGKPEIRLMLPLSLSYDHRVINGADAARFVVKVAGLLSDPFQLLSEV